MKNHETFRFSKSLWFPEGGGADVSIKQSGDTLREREMQEDKTWNMQALKIIHSLCYV
jgi:hypothetical protein